jgi:chromosome segregation ATPase
MGMTMTDKSDRDIDSWKLEDIMDRRNDKLAQLRAHLEQENINARQHWLNKYEEAQDEIAQLRAEVAKLTAERNKLDEQVGEQTVELEGYWEANRRLTFERDAAVVQGLEIAKEMIFAAAKGMKPWSYRLTRLCEDIAAEIAKRKKNT